MQRLGYQTQCSWALPATQLSSTVTHLPCTPHSTRCQQTVCQQTAWLPAQRKQATRIFSVQAVSAPAESVQALADLQLQPIVTQEMIQPDIPPGTEAAVFAIYNENKQLQYVGFSKDLYNSLRTVFSRRPDKAFFYKAVYLDKLDQQQMMDIRNAWFEECGGPPIGNKLALERAAWQQPVASGAISQRGKQAAAEEQVRTLMTLIKARGCKEEFLPNPALLQEGLVDFLPSKAMTAEEMAVQQAKMAELAKQMRTVDFSLDGNPARYELLFQASFTTNGGKWFDVQVTFEQKQTTHRVIVGREYYEDFGLEPEQVVEMVFTFLLQKNIPRQTEGMLLMNQFPINYFSISEVDQQFDDFAEIYESAGRHLQGEGKFWRFNRIHDYGSQNENMSNFTFNVVEPVA